MESLAGQISTDDDFAEIQERFLHYHDHPIDLNSEDNDALKFLIFLSPIQINNIRKHIAEKGKLVDLLELQSIDGFTLEDVQKLLPFVTIKAASSTTGHISLKNLSQFSKHDLVIRVASTLELQKGFQALEGNRYLGTPLKTLFRYKYSFSDRIAAALVLEKDAGEYFWKGSKPFQTDFSSGHIAIKRLGIVRQLIIGDFSLQYGQGLTLWSGFAFGKAPDVASIAKRDVGLKAYSSANEFSFFRGLAATTQITKNLNATLFGSSRKLDASLEIDSNGTSSLSTLNETGLHRTQTELDNRNAIRQRVLGGAIQFQKGTLSAAAVAFHTALSRNFLTGEEPYRLHYFNGDKLFNVGISYSYTYRNCYLFGETAKSLIGGWATVNGLIFSLSSKISGALLHRLYQTNYHNFFNQATSESSQATNENGLYVGINFTLRKGLLLAIYTDYFNFPWLKFRVDAPSKGHEALTQLTFSPSKSFKMLFRYKGEFKELNTIKPAAIKYLDQIHKNTYRTDVDWKFSKKISLQHRLEFNTYKADERMETGFLAYQDFSYRAIRSRLSGNIRLAYFLTESFNTRIYAYEDDVLYNFSFAAYNEKGYRFYINLNYNIAKNVEAWFRYGIFYYPDKTSVGSGLDEIAGQKKSDIKFQVRYQF